MRRVVVLEYVQKTTAEIVVDYPDDWDDATLSAVLLSRENVIAVWLEELTGRPADIILS